MTEDVRLDARPSVKLVRNAKGDVQIEVKAIAGDECVAEAKQARDVAVLHFDELAGRYPYVQEPTLEEKLRASVAAAKPKAKPKRRKTVAARKSSTRRRSTRGKP